MRVYRMANFDIIESCVRVACVLQGILQRVSEGATVKEAYMERVAGAESESEIFRNRMILRKYLRDLKASEQKQKSV